MKIALLHPWCWPWVQRGGERMFADLSEYLAGAGHSVVTVSSGPSPSRSAEGNLQRVVHRALAPPRLRRFDVDQAVAYLPQAAWTLRREGPDVVHGMYHLDGIAARMAHVRPYVVHIQGMPRRQNAAGRPVHRRLLGPSLAGAAAVIAVSEAAARALQSEFGIPARAVPNGVFLDRFAEVRATPGPSRPTILFPGAVDDPRKRLDVLLDAVPHLSEKWPDVVVAVAGKPSEERRQALAGRVHFLDVASPADMVKAYAAATVTCLPAVDEAFGLVFVESFAAGRPAVGIDDGGVPEVVSDPSWLARPDDPVDLAVVLDRALSDAEDPTCAERCRAMAEPFDWSRRGPAFEALYRDVIAAG